jgi:hypothetical protein
MSFPLCERCWERESTGWIRLKNQLYWRCPTCIAYEDRRRQKLFGEPGDGTLFNPK